jgi:hypothetical protein
LFLRWIFIPLKFCSRLLQIFVPPLKFSVLVHLICSVVCTICPICIHICSGGLGFRV